MESEEFLHSDNLKIPIPHLPNDSIGQSVTDSKHEFKINNILNQTFSPSSTQGLEQNQENGTKVLAFESTQPLHALTQQSALISPLSLKTEPVSVSTSFENDLSVEPEQESNIPVCVDGKKKRGRPRLHPETFKVKKSTRGRPRSETSKRALKEAAKVAAQNSPGNTENEQTLGTDSNTSINSTPASQLPKDEAIIFEKSASEIVTVKPSEELTLDNGNALQEHEADGNSTSTQSSSTKRKASESSTPVSSEPKSKLKKIKKEKSNDKKQVNNASTASPSIPTDSSVHVSETEDNFSSYIAPPPKKKKTTDSIKKTKKTPNGANDSYQHSQDHNKDEYNSYCICRKGDTGEWMIACDHCDEWFHGSCVNLTESMAQLLIKYVCSRCTESTQLTSIFKRKCRLPECDLPIEYEEHIKGDTNPTPISKYCSTDHGVQFFKNLINKAPTQKVFDPNVLTPSQLASFINCCKSVKQFHKLGTKFPAAKLLPKEEEIEASFSESDKNLVSQLQQKFDEIQEKLKYNDLKTQFIGQCKERAKLISEELIKQGLLNGDIDEEPKRTKKKKKQPKLKRDICGYNSKLTLGDDEWIEFINSDIGQTMLTQDLRQLEEQDRTFVCLYDRRKCPRHSGWQSLTSEFAANLERFYTVEQEKMKSQISEIYYKQQVQLMTLSGINFNENNGNDNQTITC